jgi:prepilin-type N-terminal cleavage/methylation domain-containing protein
VTRRNQERRGFTLVELLVVLGIIVTLVSLLMAGFSAVRIAQQEKATEDIVRKLQGAIENQRTELVTQAAKDRRGRTAQFQSLVTFCDNDEDRAEALLVYLKLRHAFPQTRAEAILPVTLTVGATTYFIAQPHKAYAALPNTSSWSPHDQSAAILYAFASNMGAGGATFATDDATGGNQMDHSINSVTARVFHDARGNPIGFKRFWQSTELDTDPAYSNLKDAFKDPFDTKGRLATVVGNWTVALKGVAEAAVFVPGNGQTFDNRNKSITAYSLGQNKLDEALLGDDVLGYRLHKLGNRGSK